MSEKIKEMLDRLDYDEWEIDLYKVPINWLELYEIRNYIINLEQLEKEHRKINGELREENKKLKERIEYLERSNNRREETILQQREELVDLDMYKSRIDKTFEDKEILDYLKELKEGDDNDVR